jgi:hypothetical protein
MDEHIIIDNITTHIPDFLNNLGINNQNFTTKIEFMKQIQKYYNNSFGNICSEQHSFYDEYMDMFDNLFYESFFSKLSRYVSTDNEKGAIFISSYKSYSILTPTKIAAICKFIFKKYENRLSNEEQYEKIQKLIATEKANVRSVLINFKDEIINCMKLFYTQQNDVEANLSNNINDYTNTQLLRYTIIELFSSTAKLLIQLDVYPIYELLIRIISRYSIFEAEDLYIKQQQFAICL